MNRVALVTGGGRGIGRATALKLVKDGLCVTVMARTESDLGETVNQIEDAGGVGRVLAVIGDVSRESDADAAVRKTEESFGRLDVVVNNAGIFRTAPLVETATEMWHSILETNLTGAFFVTRAAVRLMRRSREGGFVVNVSSVAGKKGFPGSAAYCASKFGLVGFSAALREELRPLGIRVVVICPGQVDTKAWDGCGLDLDAIGIRRDAMMRAEDVANTVSFAIQNGHAAPDEILLTPRAGE